jgi:ankyrin repeat protein
MLSNMAIGAGIIGSITLLMIKKDEQTSRYRDALNALNIYSKMHNFDRRFRKRLLSQSKLFFKHQQMTDEEVLRNLPLSVRRQVLRRLYLPSLLHTSLMKGLRQQFVDALLINCTVEMFNAGEEILARGNESSDLFLLIEGNVKLLDAFSADSDKNSNVDGSSSNLGGGSYNGDDPSFHNTSIADEDHPQLASMSTGCNNKVLGPGNFINEISFFTETPQTVTVRTLRPCRTLSLSQSNYKRIAAEHSGSVRRILQNLLNKAEQLAEEVGVGISMDDMSVSKRLMILSAESTRDFHVKKSNATTTVDHDGDGDGHDDLNQCVAKIQARAAVVACKDLVRIHIEKMQDDCTTRFLFAASRGNTVYISLMCDQGMDPNATDYDKRTALMVASMRGNIDAVLKLLHYDANPNLVDANGTTALMEATRCGHDDVADVLMDHGATLQLIGPCAAGILCQTVFEGDMVKLRRLLKAKIMPDVCDYDKRTAAHIAASEGNLPALKLLAEYGANLQVRDRWDNTPYDEAQRVQAQPVIEFLLSTTETTTSGTTPITTSEQ